MPVEQQTRASQTLSVGSFIKTGPQISAGGGDFKAIAQHMYNLMLRNISTDGYSFIHPENQHNPVVTDLAHLNVPFIESVPGCVIAAPSFAVNTAGVNQDYVYHWIRDAAITMFEVIAANQPVTAGESIQTLIDYVNFSKTCQDHATPAFGQATTTLGHACFTIDGRPRDWSEQSDGPALQTLAILQAYNQLDTATQTLAKQIIKINLGYLLTVYQNQTRNLWEEVDGFSFFTRSVQLRCFISIKNNSIGVSKPAGLDQAISWLQQALPQHWNNTGKYYISVLNLNSSPSKPFYDPNIDIISASLYGAIPRTDTKLLATAAKLRDQWANDNSVDVYPINQTDRNLGLGPLLGRYPGDDYDGGSPSLGKHPWALCTSNLSELYYGLAQDLLDNKQNIQLNNLIDDLSQTFFAQVGVDKNTAKLDAAQLLINAGDAMLKSVIFHSDHLELSEQFDGVNGYEKSVKNLTWSYAAFLSAVRARNGENIVG